MEIEQQIKEFTSEGECVVVYTLTSVSGYRVTITNADAAVVGYGRGNQQWLAGYDEFLRRPIDGRCKLWEACVQEQKIQFNREDNGIPRQVEYRLLEDGTLELLLLRPKSLPWSEEPFRPLSFRFNDGCEYRFCESESLSRSQIRELFGEGVLEVASPYSDGFREVFVVQSEDVRLSVESSFPRFNAEFRSQLTTITPVDAPCDIYDYDRESVAAGGEAVIRRFALKIE